jgi:hypothetical protein
MSLRYGCGLGSRAKLLLGFGSVVLIQDPQTFLRKPADIG